MTSKSWMALTLAIGVLVLAEPTRVGAGLQQRTFREQRIRFARGANSATVHGSVRQDRAMLYRIGAKAGLRMTIALAGDAKTRFDLWGQRILSGQALASGTTEWTGTLTDDGDYAILVITDDRVNAPFTLSVAMR